MKLTESTRPRRTKSADVMRLEPAPDHRALIEGLLHSPYVKQVREWVGLPETELDDTKKEAILASWWVGRLDQAYANQLRDLPWLKEFAYSEARGVYSGQHKKFSPPELDETEHQYFEYACVETALEYIPPVLDLFPTARQDLRLGNPESSFFPAESFDTVLQQVNKYEKIFERKAEKAVQLIQIWPDKRQEIIDRLLGKAGAWLKKIEQAAAQNSYSDDFNLAMLLLLFPDKRSSARNNILANAQQILKNRHAVSADGTDRKTYLFLLCSWPVLVLAAEEAGIDESGRIQLEFKPAAVTPPTPLPERPLA